MDARDIRIYLSHLGQELALLGIQRPVRILLLGGAFMLTQVKVRRTTDDIDVLPLDQNAADEATGTPIALALWNAAHAVAFNDQLPTSWFNTIIADFVRAAGDIPAGTLWQRSGPLEIYLPPKEYIFVLKLLANREKDQRDIEALCKVLKIRTRQQAQRLIDAYMPEKEAQIYFAIPEALAMHFPS